MRKGNTTFDEGNHSLRRLDCVMAVEQAVQHAGQDVQASDIATLLNDGHDHNFERGQLGFSTILSLCASGWAWR